MTTTVDQILERARAAAQELAPFESSALFAASIRLAAAQGATLRSQLLQLDGAGQLSLLPFDDRAPNVEPGYLAPELLEGDAANLKLSEPRVQVFAAGALGYELLTGWPPPDPRTPPGQELSGPLGDIVRIALAGDRRERFGDLTQLGDAVVGVQPQLGADRERQVFAKLLARSAKWGEPQESELSVQVEKLAARFEEMRARVDKFQQRQAELLERLERYQDGQQLAEAGLRKPSSSWVPTALAALLASVLTLGGAWQLGFLQTHEPQPRSADPRALALPELVPAAAAPFEPAPSEHGAGAAAAAAAPSLTAAKALPTPPEQSPSTPAANPSAAHAENPADSNAANAAGANAASPAAASTTAANAASTTDANAANAGAASPTAANPTAAPPSPPALAAPHSAHRAPASRTTRPAPASSGSLATVSSQRMLHAVAQSQVNRGEKALELNRIEEALTSFREALDTEAGLAVAYRGLGMAYAMQSNNTMALQSYQKYLRLAPGAADARDIRKAIEEIKSRAKLGGADDK